jgi:CubicO group peptidase (beta-lactamase class C family)
VLDGLAEFCVETLAACRSASVSVAVARGDGVVLAEAFGMADIAGGRPATSDTAYLLASVTKPIMATAVCVAAEAGLLELDEPIEKYLSGRRLNRPRGYGAPTVRQVLQHRGGLGKHYDFSYADSAAIMPTARGVMTRYGMLYREPGTRFEYSNLGYGLLDMVLGTVSAQEPAEFVRDRVFGPLGLASCHIGPSYPGPAPEALRYAADGRRYPSYDTSHRGASLGWASAPDLAMFGLSQADGPGVLSRGMSAVMCTALPTSDHRLGYGLGWCVSIGDRHTIVCHSGSMGGVATMLIVVPDQQLSVCVLTNQTGMAARTAVVSHVMSELVPAFAVASLPPIVDAEHIVTVPPGSWAGYVITYAGAVPLALRISPDLRAEVRLNGGAAVPAHILAGSENWDLRLTAPVQLPTPDARVASPQLGLELSADRDGSLSGAARAYSDGEDGGWLGNFLSHWCELRQVI